MLAPAVTFFTVVLALHIASIVVAFGITFAYPVMYSVGIRTEPRSMPGLHRIQDQVGKFVISPFMGLALLCGIYLASKLHVWSQFYVQWGLAVIIVVGALGGMFFAPRERRLAELAAQDVAQAGDGEVVFGAEYKALRQLVFRVNTAIGALILLTIFFMTAQTG
jgi:FtsH-binding integral membrane protein